MSQNRELNVKIETLEEEKSSALSAVAKYRNELSSASTAASALLVKIDDLTEKLASSNRRNEVLEQKIFLLEETYVLRFHSFDSVLNILLYH